MADSNTKKLKFFKLIFFILTIFILIFLSIKLFPLFSNLGTTEGQLEFKEKFSSDASGFFMLLGLQLMQILVPVLPGEPIEFLSGMCYGSFNGMLLVFLGAFLSSFIIFFCVRKFGKNFIYTFLGEENFNKINNSKLFSDPKKIELFLFIVFLIPGTPKDLFVYISGLLPIKPLKFLLISTFARFPSIISSTFAGANIVNGNWQISVIAYLITFLVSGIGLYIYNKFSKTKEKI